MTLHDQIVLSVGVCKHASDHGAEAMGDNVIEALDTLHLRKIDLADWVLILNVGGYIGKSTRRELEYAQSMGKPVKLLTSHLQPSGYPTAVESWEQVSILTTAAFILQCGKCHE